MVDKKHLEEALEFLINEEEEKAVASFHNFIVSKARAIHESLMEDDEIDDEIDEAVEDDDTVEEAVEDDDDKVEEAADEDDSDKVEEAAEDDDEAVEEGFNEFYGATDLVGEEDDDMVADVDADVAVDDEFGDDMGGETVEVEADLIRDLQAKFDELLGDAGMGDEVEDDFDDMEGGDMGDEVAFGDEVEDEVDENQFGLAEADDDDEAVEEAVTHDAGVAKPENSGTDRKGGGDHSRHSQISHTGDGMSADNAKLSETEDYDFDLTEEDFLDLEEGLKAVSVSMGGEQGGVKYAGEETNTKSPVADKDKSDVNADPKDGVSKQKVHDGYKREAAPSNDKLPHSNENNHDKAEGTPGRSTVAGHGGLESNSGNGGEQGKKKFAGTETNTKSPIGSAGTRNEK